MSERDAMTAAIWPPALLALLACSVGLASPGAELRLTDAGEICVHSDYLMDGYFDAPDKSAEVLRDGWFHTGEPAGI